MIGVIPGGPLSASERITIAEIESFLRHHTDAEGAYYHPRCSSFIVRDLRSLEARGIIRVTRNDDGSHNALLTSLGTKLFAVTS